MSLTSVIRRLRLQLEGARGHARVIVDSEDLNKLLDDHKRLETAERLRKRNES